MIQYVTCNKSWLFAPRQKNSKKQRKEKYPSGTRKKFKCFWINFSNSFLYEIEAWTTLQCNLNWIQTFKLNSNTLNGIWIQSSDWIKIQLKINGMQIGGKGSENILVNMVLKKWIKT